MSLALKYRPRRFEDVVGQEVPVRIIVGAIGRGCGRVIILSGTRGCGKTTLARIIGSAVNDWSDFYDLLEVDGATYTSVDTVREVIIPYAETAPVLGKNKVVIVDECQALSKAAWQALLKTIEEPSDCVYFVFCTTELDRVPDAVVSRGINVALQNLSVAVIEKQLTKIATAESIAFEPPAMKIIAVEAAGSMREAITIMESALYAYGAVTAANTWAVLGGITETAVADLVDAVCEIDRKRVMTILDGIDAHEQLFKAVLRYLVDNVSASYAGRQTALTDPQEASALLKRMFQFRLKMMAAPADVSVLVRAFFAAVLADSEKLHNTTTKERISVDALVTKMNLHRVFIP